MSYMPSYLSVIPVLATVQPYRRLYRRIEYWTRKLQGRAAYGPGPLGRPVRYGSTWPARRFPKPREPP